MNKNIIKIAAAVLGGVSVVGGVGGWVAGTKAAHLVQEHALEMLQQQYPDMTWTVSPSTVSYFPLPSVYMPSVSGVAKVDNAPLQSVQIDDLTGHVDLLALNRKDVPPISSIRVGHIHASYLNVLVNQPGQGEVDLNNVEVHRFDKGDPRVSFSGSLKDTSLKPITFTGDASADNIEAVQNNFQKADEWSLHGHIVAKSTDGGDSKPVELVGKLRSQNNVIYSDLHVLGDSNSINSDTVGLNLIPNIKDADVNLALEASTPESFKDLPNANWHLVSFYGTVKSAQAGDLVSKLETLKIAQDIPKQLNDLLPMAKDVSLQDITFLTHEKRLHTKLNVFNAGQKQGLLEVDGPLDPRVDINSVGAVDVSFTGLGKNPSHYALHTSAWDNKQSDISFEVVLPENDRTSMQLSDLWKVSATKNAKPNIQNKMSAQGVLRKGDNGFEVNLDKVHGDLNGAQIEGNIVAEVSSDFAKLQGVTANFRSPQLYVTQNPKGKAQKAEQSAVSGGSSDDLNKAQEAVAHWVMDANKIRVNFKPASLAFNEVNYHNPSFSIEIGGGKGRISATDSRQDDQSLLADIYWDVASRPTKWRLSAHPMMVPSSYLAYLLGQSHLIEGPVYLTGNLELTGYTEEQFVQSATGSLGLAMHSGEISKEAVVPLVGKKWSSFLSVLMNGNIGLRCAGTVTNWNAGVMQIKHLGIITKHISMTGEGSEQFRDHLLQLTVQPRLTLLGRSVSRTVAFKSQKGNFEIQDGGVDQGFQMGNGGKPHESCETLFASSRLGEEQEKLTDTAPGQTGFEDILSGK